MKTINLHNIYSITKKELKNYFDNPTAYIVIIVFLLLWEFLFFKSVFLVGEASLDILFNFLPWLFLFSIPAITMGSISQEKSEGTLELLLTHPLRDYELLIGKFLAAVAFFALTLLFIFPIAASLAAFGNLDWGIVFGQYLASIFMASVLIALGIFISSLLTSQISSLLVSVAMNFVFIIVGFEIVTASLPLFLTPFFEQLSVLSHFNSMARGVIDLRDFWYFLSAIFVFLSLAYLQFLKRRFGNKKSLYRSYKIGITLFIGIAVLTNIVGSRIPGRIDLTQDHLYTLTSTTKKTLGELKDVVNITLFASSELPARLQPTLRDIKDILRDYQIFGKGNIVVTTKNPNGNPDIAREATSVGVREIQFNVVGQEELKLQKGFLGLAVSYAGKSEAIPFVQDTSDLEYQLTSFIKKLTTNEKKKIVFLSGHGEKNLFSDYRLLSQELKKQFEVETITIDKENPIFPKDTKTLVIAGPTQEIDETTQVAIRDYLANGGAVMFLIDTVSISPQTLSVFPNQNSFANFLENYGVNIRPNLIYDLRSNESVSFSGGLINYIVPYPFWIRAIATSTNQITARLESIVLPWASSLTINNVKLKEAGFEANPLFHTTRFSGTQQGSFSISPETPLSRQNLSEQIVAVSLVKTNGKTTRMVIVGDSDFLSDQFIQNSPENLAFGMESLSWLTQEESLAGIKIKQKIEHNLLFENQTQVKLVKYANMLFAFLLPVGFGMFRLMRRKNLRKLIYSSSSRL